MWAAFYPEDPSAPHPLFPAGPAIQQLTMFADYRVPQILYHLRMLSYPPALVELLEDPPRGAYRLKGRVRVHGSRGRSGFRVDVVGPMIRAARLPHPPQLGELVVVGLELDADDPPRSQEAPPSPACRW